MASPTVVPKSVFQQKADTLVGRLIYGLRFFSYLFYPVIFIFSRIARFATRLAGGSTQEKLFITREELRVLLDITESSTAKSPIDRQSIRRIIRFADTTVLLVSHGDALQILQTAFHRMDASRHRQLDHLDTAEIRLLTLA